MSTLPHVSLVLLAVDPFRLWGTVILIASGGVAVGSAAVAVYGMICGRGAKEETDIR